VHAPPVWGTVTTAQVCSWNEAQVTAVAGAAAGVLWTIAGDFNADPTAQGFVAPTVGAVVRGQNATQQGGGILDYSVTNAGVGYTFVAPSQLVGASDHYPQEFNW
jgi:hypothetical protein